MTAVLSRGVAARRGRRTLLAGVAGLAAAGAGAWAQTTAPKVAVLSLIGDTITVVSARLQTGSQLDQNRREVVALPPGTFDRQVLLLADRHLRRQGLAGDTALLLPEREAYQQVDAWLGDGRFAAPEWLRSTLAPHGATRLLVVSKVRDEARLRVVNGHIGAGVLEGLGFYVDRHTPMFDGETNQSTEGYLAPFAYLRFTLVDLASSRVLGQRRATESTTVTPGRSKETVDPWEALSAREKLGALQQLVDQELAEGLGAIAAQAR